MTELEKLAVKAVEARKAFVETDLPEGSIGHSMLFVAGVQTNTAYHSAATPEAILTLTARNRELEEALREAPCPRPANCDPEDTTAGQCIERGNCGCVYGGALAAKPDGE